MIAPPRRSAVLAGLLTVLVALLVPATSGAAAAAPAVVTPSHDGYVRADLPDSNFGADGSILVDAQPVTNGYLRFEVTGLTGAITGATLRLYSRSSGTTPVKVHTVADVGWNQESLTYANAPAVGPLIGTTGPLTAGTWAQVDVTPAVRGGGDIAFALVTGSTAVRTLDSLEGANPPQLEIATSSDPVLLAAGDIACATTDANYNGGDGTTTRCRQKHTAALIGPSNPAALLMLGDGQYPSGAIEQYTASYGPTWGQYRAATRPVVGNHEYGRSGAGGYFSYFGDAATPLQPGCRKACNGWYSFDVGTWHVVAINTECTRLPGGAGCAAGSVQHQWLAADLAAHANRCTLVFGHRPRWSSNSFASADIAPLVDVMRAAGVDLYVAGHSHAYERFAPQDASGAADPGGIREFVVGTGGVGTTSFGTVVANSEVRAKAIFGLLKLTLHADSYSWSFVSDPVKPYNDSGSATCV